VTWWLDNDDYGDPFNGFWENKKMKDDKSKSGWTVENLVKSFTEDGVYVGPKPHPSWYESGPDVSDGLDSEDFKGGDQRHGHRPTTLESALRYLAEFIPGDERRYQMDAIVSQLGHLGAKSDCWKKIK
jgi:hypothetical protein